MDEELRAKILEVLGRQYLMTVATIRPDGYPQATTVNYTHDDDFTLYFATDAASQKAGNLALNNKVSVAIVDRAENFYKLLPVAIGHRFANPCRDRGRGGRAALVPGKAAVTPLRSARPACACGLCHQARSHRADRLRRRLRHHAPARALADP